MEIAVLYVIHWYYLAPSLQLPVPRPYICDLHLSGYCFNCCHVTAAVAAGICVFRRRKWLQPLPKTLSTPVQGSPTQTYQAEAQRS